MISYFRYGEIVNINLVRDKKTGKQKGFCFLCYEDQRSTILAVDNFNGIKVKKAYKLRVKKEKQRWHNQFKFTCHLSDMGPVVQSLNIAIQWINSIQIL